MEITNYLYIVPFKNGRHFKIGVSSNNYIRIVNHNKTYSVNINDTIILSGSKTDVKNLESILLKGTPKLIPEIYKGKDGGTEVRDIKHLNTCLEDIKRYVDRFKLKELSITDEDVKNANKKPTKTKKQVISVNKDTPEKIAERKLRVSKSTEEKRRKVREEKEFYKGHNIDRGAYMTYYEAEEKHNLYVDSVLETIYEINRVAMINEAYRLEKINNQDVLLIGWDNVPLILRIYADIVCPSFSDDNYDTEIRNNSELSDIEKERLMNTIECTHPEVCIYT